MIHSPNLPIISSQTQPNPTLLLNSPANVLISSANHRMPFCSCPLIKELCQTCQDMQIPLNVASKAQQFPRMFIPTVFCYFYPYLRSVVGVFLCGPQQLAKTLRKYCSQHSSLDPRNVQFYFNKENF